MRSPQKQHGFKGMYVLVDRKAGEGITFSLWETEADMKASEEAANRVRSQVTAGTKVEATVERYEVAVHSYGLPLTWIRQGFRQSEVQSLRPSRRNPR